MFVEGVFFGEVLDNRFKLLKMVLSCYQNSVKIKSSRITYSRTLKYLILRVTKPTTKSYFLN